MEQDKNNLYLTIYLPIMIAKFGVDKKELDTVSFREIEANNVRWSEAAYNNEKVYFGLYHSLVFNN